MEQTHIIKLTVETVSKMFRLFDSPEYTLVPDITFCYCLETKKYYKLGCSEYTGKYIWREYIPTNQKCKLCNSDINLKEIYVNNTKTISPESLEFIKRYHLEDPDDIKVVICEDCKQCIVNQWKFATIST